MIAAGYGGDRHLIILLLLNRHRHVTAAFNSLLMITPQKICFGYCGSWHHLYAIRPLNRCWSSP